VAAVRAVGPPHAWLERSPRGVTLPATLFPPPNLPDAVYYLTGARCAILPHAPRCADAARGDTVMPTRFGTGRVGMRDGGTTLYPTTNMVNMRGGAHGQSMGSAGALGMRNRRRKPVCRLTPLRRDVVYGLVKK